MRFCYHPAQKKNQLRKTIRIQFNFTSKLAIIVLGKTTARFGKKKKKIQFSAIFKLPFILIEKSLIDFGNVMIGNLVKVKTKLTNPSSVSAEFEVEVIENDFCKSAFKCDRPVGILKPDQQIELTVSFKPFFINGVFSQRVHLNYGGGVIGVIDLQGKSTNPDVKVEPFLVVLGTVQMGKKITREFFIQNNEKKRLSFEIKNTNKTFLLDQISGVLECNEKRRINVAFNPSFPINYLHPLFIFIESYEIKIVFLYGDCNDFHTKPIPIRQALLELCNVYLNVSKPTIPEIRKKGFIISKKLITENSVDIQKKASIRINSIISNEKSGYQASILSKNIGYSSTDHQKGSFDNSKNSRIDFSGFKNSFLKNRLKPIELSTNKEQLANNLAVTKNNLLLKKLSVGTEEEIKRREEKQESYQILAGFDQNTFIKMNSVLDYYAKEFSNDSSFFSCSQINIKMDIFSNSENDRNSATIIFKNKCFERLDFYLEMNSETFVSSQKMFTLIPDQEKELTISLKTLDERNYYLSSMTVYVNLASQKINLFMMKNPKRALPKMITGGVEVPKEEGTFCSQTDIKPYYIGSKTIKIYAGKIHEKQTDGLSATLIECQKETNFGAIEIGKKVIRILQIKNNSDQNYFMKISTPEKPFFIFGKHFELKRNSSLKFAVYFEATRYAHFKVPLKLKFGNGQFKKIIELSAFVLEAKLTIENRGVVIFPPNYVNTTRKQTLLMINEGTNPMRAVINVDEEDQSAVSFNPQIISLEPRERKNVVCSFTPKAMACYHVRCPVIIENSEQTPYFMIIGTGSDGDVKFETQTLDFGVTTLSKPVKKRLSILNNSEISFEVVVKFNDSEVEYLDGLAEFMIDKLEMVIQPKGERTLTLTFIPNKACSGSINLYLFTKSSKVSAMTNISRLESVLKRKLSVLKPFVHSQLAMKNKLSLMNSKTSQNNEIGLSNKMTKEMEQTLNRKQSFSTSKNKESTNSMVFSKNQGLFIKDICKFIFKAEYPKLKIVNIKGKDFTTLSLWTKFQVDEFNQTVQNDNPIFYRKSSKSKPEFVQEEKKDEMIKFIWDFGCIVSKFKTVTSRTIIIKIKNTGNISLNWTLDDFPGHIVEDLTETKQETKESMTLLQQLQIQKTGSNLFEIKPTRVNKIWVSQTKTNPTS